MKQALFAFVLALVASVGSAQTTAVSTTGVVDSDGTTWVGATWKINFVVSPTEPNRTKYINNGAPVSESVLTQTGTLNGSGAATITVYDNTLTTPLGSQWQLSICPNATWQCFLYTFVASGPTLNLTSVLNSLITPPRFQAIAGAKGYADIEAINPSAASTYWDVVNNCQKNYTGSSWICSGGGSGTVSGQINGKIPLATGPTIIGAPSHLDDGVTTPGTITATEPFAGISTTLSSIMKANASITSVSPRADIRWWGAVVDGVTPIDTALNAAISSCNAADGNACEIFLPCGGTDGCLLDNGPGLTASPGGVNVIYTIQGHLQLNSTLAQPGATTFRAGGGAFPSQFNAFTPAAIFAPQARGTLGTAITTTGTPVTFTPTYSLGSIANYRVGSVISAAGMQTCDAIATRITTAVNLPNTTYTLSNCTDSNGNAETARIPEAKTIVVTGCGDAGFNGTGLTVIGQDWPQSQITTYSAGSAVSTTGCTVVGFDDNTYDADVVVSAVSGNTVTATFGHPHSANDVWGAVGVYMPPSTNTHNMEGIEIGRNWGMGLLIGTTPTINLTGVAVGASSWEASGAMEVDGGWWGQWNGLRLSGSQPLACYANCPTNAYPYALRCSQDVSNNIIGIGCSSIGIDNMTVFGGIKIDTNGTTFRGSGSGYNLGPIHNLIVERTNGASFMVDNRFLAGANVSITADQVLQSDNYIHNTQYFVGATDCCIRANAGSVNLGTFNSWMNSGLTVNPYWEGGVNVGNVDGPLGGIGATLINPDALSYDTRAGGVLTSNRAIRADFVGVNAGFAPITVPTTTLAVTTSPSCATCSTVTGPFGTANALEIQSDGSGNTVNVQVGSTSVTVYKGDYIIFGAMIQPGNGAYGGGTGSQFGRNWYYSLGGSGTNTLFNVVSGGTTMPLAYDGWQAGTQIAKAIANSSGAQTITFSLSSSKNGSTPGMGNRYYNWKWAYVPGPNNPSYTGVTQAEVMRWAQQMFKGYVPSAASPGLLYAVAPLVLPADPTTALQAATKQYVDAHITTLPIATTSVLGGVKCDGTSITCAGDGTISAPSGTFVSTVPPWLQWQGDGSEAAPTCTSGCTVTGEHWYASVNVPIGQTMISSSSIPLILRSTGTCTIAGTISVSNNTGGASGVIGASNYSGSGGGGGFGAANGTAGTLSSPASGGAAGTSGVSGGNGTAQTTQTQHSVVSNNFSLGGSNQAGSFSLVVYGGSPGGAGGSSGGAGGKGGGLVIIDCQTINFTGTVDASGTNGGAGGANTGGGGGGGGGIVILRSPNMTNSGSINTANGTGGAIGTGTSTKGGDGAAGWSKVFSQ